MTHSRVPQPFTVSEPIDYEDGRVALSELAERRKTARQDLETAKYERSQKEFDYRKGRSLARVTCKGSTGADRKEEIDGATAELRKERDDAEIAIEIIEEKLEEIDAQRASIHRLLDWSAKFEPQETRAPRAA